MKGRILVVDDNDELLAVIGDILADAGYEVTVATNPDDAWVECDTKRFDMVFCDLVMPTEFDGASEGAGSAMVGVHAISEFKKRYPALPVVAISGQVAGEPLNGIRQFGASATIAKPFGRDELITTVESLLSSHN